MHNFDQWRIIFKFQIPIRTWQNYISRAEQISQGLTQFEIYYIRIYLLKRTKGIDRSSFFSTYLPALWWTASRARSRPASAVSARCVRCRCVCEVRPGCPCPGWIDTSDEAHRPWHHRWILREHRHRPRRCDFARFPYLRRFYTRARARELLSHRYAIPRILCPMQPLLLLLLQRGATRRDVKDRASTIDVTVSTHTYTHTLLSRDALYTRVHTARNVNNGRERDGTSSFVAYHPRRRWTPSEKATMGVQRESASRTGSCNRYRRTAVHREYGDFHELSRTRARLPSTDVHHSPRSPDKAFAASAPMLAASPLIAVLLSHQTLLPRMRACRSWRYLFRRKIQNVELRVLNSTTDEILVGDSTYVCTYVCVVWRSEFFRIK